MLWNDLKRGYQYNLDIERAKSPHDILGVDAKATKAELRKAYINKVKVYHPDCADTFLREYNQEMLKIINLAYDKLKEAP